MNNKHQKDFCKSFGSQLRKLRLSKGYGLREFALFADMEYSQLSKIERGVTNPTLNTVLNLAIALDIEHTELFNFKFSRPTP